MPRRVKLDRRVRRDGVRRVAGPAERDDGPGGDGGGARPNPAGAGPAAGGRAHRRGSARPGAGRRFRRRRRAGPRRRSSTAETPFSLPTSASSPPSRSRRRSTRCATRRRRSTGISCTFPRSIPRSSPATPGTSRRRWTWTRCGRGSRTWSENTTSRSFRGQGCNARIAGPHDLPGGGRAARRPGAVLHRRGRRGISSPHGAQHRRNGGERGEGEAFRGSRRRNPSGARPVRRRGQRPPPRPLPLARVVLTSRPAGTTSRGARA